MFDTFVVSIVAGDIETIELIAKKTVRIRQLVQGQGELADMLLRHTAEVAKKLGIDESDVAFVVCPTASLGLMASEELSDFITTPKELEELLKNDISA